MNKTAFAIVAHPDDIEFRIAGTLLLLKKAGWQIHYMAIANGSLGSAIHSPTRTRRMRRAEAQDAARILGAEWHPSLMNDLEIFYTLPNIRRLAAIVREVRPDVILTHPPQDYMEDHTNACRLALAAAFTRGMPGLRTQPSRPPWDGEVAVYHCMPHGMCDPLCRPVIPQFYVNIARVMETKRAALAAHRSQVEWLEASQGMDAFTAYMEEDALTVGRMSRRFKQAEGWWQHLHLGYCGADAHPLQKALGADYLPNPAWKKVVSVPNAPV